MTIPALGLGTFRLKDDVVIASVKTALELGYRTIDTAQIFMTTKLLSVRPLLKAVRHVMNLFITTKIGFKKPEAKTSWLKASREPARVATDYVDLTLIDGHHQMMPWR
ncbi:aldo/keto reductase [Shigella flexneri]